MISIIKKWRNYQNGLIISAILLFALIIRLIFLENTGFEDLEDCYWLAALAKHIPQGKYTISNTFHSAVSPLYPTLMAILTLVTKEIFLSGKIVSLIAGIGAILVSYLLWEKLESKEIAVLTALLLAVNQAEWYYSIHVFRETLYLFFCTLSLLLLFNSMENESNLPLLGVSLGLATLSRAEGYFLTLSVLIALIYWKRKNIFKPKNLRYIVLSLLLYLLLAISWRVYCIVRTGEVIPHHLLSESEKYGYAGLTWILAISELTTLPLLILSIIGMLLSSKNKGKYLPFYIYIIIFSLPQMWFGVAYPRYAMSFLPILLGWSSVALINFASKISVSQVRYVMLFLIVGASFFYSADDMAKKQKQENPYELIKEAGIWFDKNTEENATLLTGDDNIYIYYTNKRVIGFPKFMALASPLASYIQYPYLSLIISEDIHYVIAYDSITSWLYPKNFFLHMDHEFSKEDFLEYSYYSLYYRIKFPKAFEDIEAGERLHTVEISQPGVMMEIKFLPLKKFEKYGHAIYLYRVEWQKLHQ